jgi:hypothetical protein
VRHAASRGRHRGRQSLHVGGGHPRVPDPAPLANVVPQLRRQWSDTVKHNQTVNHYHVMHPAFDIWKYQ